MISWRAFLGSIRCSIARAPRCPAASSRSWRSRAVCAASPKLLLLDEPTEGIQPSIVEEILEILIGLHRHQGLAIVVVEQSLDFIRRLSDRILLIEKGMIMGEVLPDALETIDGARKLRRR